MVSDNQIIDTVIREFPLESTFYQLVEHLSKYESINLNGKLDINTEIDMYSNKSLSKIPVDKLERLYNIFYTAWVKDSPIRSKISERMCFFLKELVKPGYLVFDDSQSLFKNKSMKNPKKDFIEEIYFIPKPFTKNYNGFRNSYNMDNIDIETQKMIDHRESVVRQNRYNNEMKKRRENQQKANRFERFQTVRRR
jgi:hypothetical protein